jgi:hypothetical protein
MQAATERDARRNRGMQEQQNGSKESLEGFKE